MKLLKKIWKRYWGLRLGFALSAAFIMFVMFLLFMPTAHAVDTTGLNYAWNFDNDYTEEIQSKTMTPTNTNFATGKVNQGLNCSDGDYTSVTGINFYTSAFSVSFWVQFKNVQETWFMGKNVGGTPYVKPFSTRYANGDGSTFFNLGDGTSQNGEFVSASYTANNWDMLTYVYTGSRQLIYRNTTLILNESSGGQSVANDGALAFRTCERVDSYGNSEIILDMITIWNRSLTASDVSDLYNSGDGIQYPYTGGGGTPGLTLSTDLTTDTKSIIDPFVFNFSGVSVNNSEIYSCDMFMNKTGSGTSWVLNDTLTDINITTEHSFNLTYGYEETAYDIRVNCSNENATDEFTRYNIFLDYILPEVNLNIIQNNSFFYKNSDTYINYSITCIDTNLLACNNTLQLLNPDGSFNKTINNVYNGSLTGLTTYTTPNIENLTGELQNGRYRIIGESWDDHNKLVFKDKNEKANDIVVKDSNNLKFKFKKGDVSIYSPDVTGYNTYDEDNSYKIEYNFKKKNDNKIYIDNAHEWQFINSKHKAHLANIKLEKYFDLNSPELHVKSVKLINDQWVITVDTDKLKVKTNSIGDVNYNEQYWYFNITNGFTFYANDSITGNLISNFTVTVFNSTYSQQKSTTNGNITFNLTSEKFLTNITASGYTSNSTGNLTFSSGGSFAYQLFAENSLYLFFYNEDTDLLINDVTVNLTVINLQNTSSKYTTSDGDVFISGFATGRYELHYDAPGYLPNYYFTTIASDTTQRIDLYLVPNTTGTLILFSIVDEKGNPIFNATLKRQRFMLNDNAYILTGMSKTDQNGETAQYLVPNNVFYRFIVDKSGTTVLSTSEQQIYSATVYLRAPLLVDELQSLDTILIDTTTNLSWNNNTKIVSYTWNSPVNSIKYGCLWVKSQTSLTQSTLFYQCTNSVSATINYNMTGVIQNDTTYTATGFLDTNTTSSRYATDILNDFVRGNSPWERFGKAGLFLGYFFIATMFLLGIAFNFSIAVVYSGLSMVALQVLGLTGLGWGFILTVTIIGLVIAVVNKI